MTGDHGAAWSAGLRLGTDAELRTWLDVARPPATRPMPRARRHFRRDLHIETKPDKTFVTEADTAIEARIRERIHAAFPDHGMVGEEYGIDDGGASVRWYIDPIDGTHNFMRGVPLFGTLLAVERDGELQASVISAPALDERWWAHRGGGAWARHGGAGEPVRIRVSAVGELESPRSSTAVGGTWSSPAGRRASSRSSTTSGASAGSATSGATRWSPRARRRRWSRSG